MILKGSVLHLLVGKKNDKGNPALWSQGKRNGFGLSKQTWDGAGHFLKKRMGRGGEDLSLVLETKHTGSPETPRSYEKRIGAMSSSLRRGLRGEVNAVGYLLTGTRHYYEDVPVEDITFLDRKSEVMGSKGDK